MFGKKQGPSGADTSKDSPPTAPVNNFPWQPQSNITGNLAVGNLRINLLERLRNERGVHAETLMVAIGALAGFAAQNAALGRVAATLINKEELPKTSLVLGQISGETYLVGDWINTFLFNDPGSQLTLYKMAGATAMQAGGIQMKDLPDFKEMVEHVVRTMGKTEFGRIRAPSGHQPALQPVEALKILWPFACKILTLPLPKGIPSGIEPPLQESHWPVVISFVAAQLIGWAKEALNPRISYALAMESAIITAKINPQIIEPGKWKIEASAGKLMVERLMN